MNYLQILVLGLSLGYISCSIYGDMEELIVDSKLQRMQIIGHRGDPSNHPDNSLHGFLSAVDKGVHAIELDVVISADKKVVVSHEPYMAAGRMLDPNGKSIPRRDERDHNLYLMQYDSIQKYTFDFRRKRKMPNLEGCPGYKPLLREVVHQVENITIENDLPPVYYIVEIKSDPDNYNRFQPEPKEFSDLVMDVVLSMGIRDRTIISSFDPNILNYTHKQYSEVPISYLVLHKGIRDNLSLLDFKPDIYSPYFRLIHDAEQVEMLQNQGIQVITWTVNRKRTIRKMIRYGVDGIITDHPERVQTTVRNFLIPRK